MSRVARYAAMGGVMDYTIYIALSLAPLLSEQWGAEPIELGILPVAWAVSYSATAVLGGRLSDRVSRTSLARAGLAIIVLTFVCLSRASQVWHFYVGLPFIAFGMAFFWPALQAAIADESSPDTLSRNLGWFNIAWSTGKGLGVLTGGILLGVLGRNGFLAAAAVGALLVFVMPRVPRGAGEGQSLAGDDTGPPAAVRNRFRIAALLANFAAFGLGTSILNHYPKWNALLGRSGVDYGIVVGGIFLTQTVAFVLLQRWPSWRYRMGPLLLLQAFAAVGALTLGTAFPVVALVAAMALVGGGLGICYYSSIYYSLHSDVARGGRAGLHEAMLGTGNFAVPLLAGVAAQVSGFQNAPYLFVALVVLLMAAGQISLLLRRGV
jgi:Major Facilitator Superfamily